MTPEARARIKIDAMLEAASWIVQSRGELNLHAGPGVAVREVPTPTGPADYVGVPVDAVMGLHRG